jgi:DNA polymerase III epsilon subunit-like protein
LPRIALALFKEDELDLKKDMEPFENRLLALQAQAGHLPMIDDHNDHNTTNPSSSPAVGARSIPASIPSWTSKIASSMSPINNVPSPLASAVAAISAEKAAAAAAASRTRSPPTTRKPGSTGGTGGIVGSKEDHNSNGTNGSVGRNGSGNGQNNSNNTNGNNGNNTSKVSSRYTTSGGNKTDTNTNTNTNGSNNGSRIGDGNSSGGSNGNNNNNNSNNTAERTQLLRESPSHALARARTVAHPHATLPSLSFPSSPAVSGTTVTPSSSNNGVTTPNSSSTLSRYSPYVHSHTNSGGGGDDTFERRRGRSSGSSNGDNGTPSRVNSNGSTGSNGSGIATELLNRDYRAQSGPEALRGAGRPGSTRTDSTQSDPGQIRHHHNVNSNGSTASTGSGRSRSSTPDSMRGMVDEDLNSNGPQSDLSEESLISLASGILMKHGAVPVGKMGSLLHKAANNHSLPALLKEKYGGLKKFLQLHEKDFVLGEDHPYNPHVSLRCLRMDDPLAAMMGQTGGSTSSRRPRRSSRRDSVSSTSSGGGDSLGSSLTSPIPSLPSSRTTSASDSIAMAQAAYVAAQREAAENHHQTNTTRLANSAPLSMVLALDCEMVGVGIDGVASILARCSVVNYDNEVVYDKYVLPTETVTDYRTHVSGIRAAHLRDGTDFRQVQMEVADIIKDRILVAHSIVADLQALQLSHPRTMIRDTAFYEPLCPGRPRSLKTLVRQQLQIEFQDGAHDSVEDARAVLGVYKTVQHEWEDALARSPDHSPLTLTSPMATSPSPSPSSTASPLSNAFSPSYNHHMGSSGGLSSSMLLSSPSPSSIHGHSHLREAVHSSPHHLAPPGHQHSHSHGGHGVYTAAHHHSASMHNGRDVRSVNGNGNDKYNNTNTNGDGMHHSHSHHHLGGHATHPGAHNHHHVNVGNHHPSSASMSSNRDHHHGHHSRDGSGDARGGSSGDSRHDRHDARGNHHSSHGSHFPGHSHMSVPPHVTLSAAMLLPSPSPSPQRVASPLSQSLNQ